MGVFSGPMIRAPSFGEPVPLGCEGHEFSLFSCLLAWGRQTRAVVGISYFPCPRSGKLCQYPNN